MSRARLLRDDTATAAVEFALVGPLFVFILIGAVTIGMLSFSATSLEAAVQDAARCAALTGAPCPNPERRYRGMTDAPLFAARTRPCGIAITARTHFALDLVVWQQDVALTATACG